VYQPRSKPWTRRRFLTASAVAACASSWAVPAIARSRKSGSTLEVGEGAHRFEVIHDWPQLPARFQWQTTHNVAVDRDGCLYVIHEGRADRPDHPSIFVFDPEGRYIRSFGQQFQGGGHGLEVRQEGGQSFLYVCAYQQVKAFAKLDLQGEVVWEKRAPMQSGIYAAGEAEHPQKIWGRDRFMPTNFAFLDDGGFLLADGYGSFYIHRYDREGNWLRHFGGPGDGRGRFQTPHGIWIDRRPGRQPAIVVCDRAHHTLQYLTMEGQHLETLDGFGLPANIDTWNDWMVVPELFARLTILDAENRVVARLGDDAARIREDEKRRIRQDSTQWQAGRFVHPHDACFDAEGNLYVAEWVATGRVTKLRRLV
jgi:hypothetical protein